MRTERVLGLTMKMLKRRRKESILRLLDSKEGGSWVYSSNVASNGEWMSNNNLIAWIDSNILYVGDKERTVQRIIAQV